MIQNLTEAGFSIPNTKVIVVNPTVQFDQAEYWRKKYGDRELRFVPHEDYLTELKQVAINICAAVLCGQEQSLNYQDRPYEFFGAIIYGSFAQGLIHNLSDVDAYGLAMRMPGLEATCDFADQVKAGGMSRQLAMKSLCIDSNPTEMQMHLQAPVVFNGRQIIVSPYPEIIETVVLGCQ